MPKKINPNVAPEFPDLSPLGGKTGPNPKTSSRTPLTDGLYSGMNTFYNGERKPFEAGAGLISDQFRGTVAPVAPVARGYLPLSDFDKPYLPAGDYTVSVPNDAESFRAGTPAAETGKSIKPERNYFSA